MSSKITSEKVIMCKLTGFMNKTVFLESYLELPIDTYNLLEKNPKLELKDDILTLTNGDNSVILTKNTKNLRLPLDYDCVLEPLSYPNVIHDFSLMDQ